MKLAKMILAATVLMAASMTFAEPKCSHKENGSLFASTNPIVKVHSSTVISPTNPNPVKSSVNSVVQ